MNFFNQNDTSASAARVPYLPKPGKPHTLTTPQSPHGSETVKAILNRPGKPPVTAPHAAGQQSRAAARSRVLLPPCLLPSAPTKPLAG
jgi:hypothetical protein